MQFEDCGEFVYLASCQCYNLIIPALGWRCAKYVIVMSWTVWHAAAALASTKQKQARTEAFSDQFVQEIKNSAGNWFDRSVPALQLAFNFLIQTSKMQHWLVVVKFEVSWIVVMGLCDPSHDKLSDAIWSILNSIPRYFNWGSSY